jgi:hypothetical protein
MKQIYPYYLPALFSHPGHHLPFSSDQTPAGVTASAGSGIDK